MIIPRDQVNVIIKNGERNGVTKQAVIDSMIRNGMQPEGLDISAWKIQEPVQKETRFEDTVKDIGGFFTDTANSSEKRAENINKTIAAGAAGEQTGAETGLQLVGQAVGGAGADAIANFTKAIGKVVLKPETEAKVKELFEKFGSAVAENPQVQNLVKLYDDLPENKQRDIDAAGGIASLAAEFIGVGAGNRATGVLKEGVTDIGTTAAKTATNIIDETAKTGSRIIKKGTTASAEGTGNGVVQTITDFAERVPRAFERVAEGAENAAARAKRIKESAPEVAQAIKVNLADDLIEAANTADDITKKAYNEVLDVAEKPKVMGSTEQPTSIGGKLAAEQFDIINKQKKEVGKQIGEKVKELSKDTTVDIHPAIQKMDDVLKHNGIEALLDDEGKIAFDFSRSNLSSAERSRIKELYNLVTETGGEVTPEVVYKKNQLFSKLQREAKFEGLGDIIIETLDGNKQSIFKTFRDIYSGTLDDVSPEMRVLNKQYAELSNLTDDIEDSILKTPNFNVVKSTDPSEFAKVNLRRIFGEANSSPAFEAVADIMDEAARKLGYEKATPKQVAAFAQRIRELYPDTIPATGFTGSVKLGLKDIAEGVINAGAPNFKDQQKALRGILRKSLNQK